MFENNTRVTAKRHEVCEEWTSHGSEWDSGLVSEPTQPPEAQLIERLRTEVRPKLSVRAAARASGISDSRWRQIIKGYRQETATLRVPVRAPADTLARMARAVGATPAQLREAGREDAADELERSVPVNTAALPKHGVQRLRDTWVVDDRPPMEPTSPRTSHDPHFDRAERLLGHAHASVRRGDHLGAINALEGVWSTVELLVDRITDEALLQGAENAEQSADTPEAAHPHAPGEADQEREVDDSCVSAAGAGSAPASGPDRDGAVSNEADDDRMHPGGGTPEVKARSAQKSARQALRGKQHESVEVRER